MDDRRLYQILAAGAGVVLLLALADALLGGNGGGGADEPIVAEATSTTSSTTTSTSAPPPASSTTTRPRSEREPAAVRTTQSNLRNGLTAQKVVYVDQQRYTDDPVQLAQVDPNLEFVRGFATVNSTPDVVHVATNGFAQVACLSALSQTGELYMIKDIVGGENEGTWYTRGNTIPDTCDDAPLEDRW